VVFLPSIFIRPKSDRSYPYFPPAARGPFASSIPYDLDIASMATKIGGAVNISRQSRGISHFWLKFSLFFAHSCQIVCAFRRYTETQQSDPPLIQSAQTEMVKQSVDINNMISPDINHCSNRAIGLARTADRFRLA
jgi:hypothetical protein